MTFHGIIFDLDGTLLYTLQDLADSVNQALADLGLPPHPLEHFNAFVGNGARMLCRRALGGAADTDPQVDRLLQGFRTYYAQYRARTTRLYDGISQVLLQLKGRGIHMAILSNKPQEDTEAVVARYFDYDLFAAVIGQSAQVPPKPDPTGVRLALDRLNLPQEQICYLGDSNVDMATAKGAGLTALGACWGYRTPEELLQAGADRLLHTPQELLDLFPAADV